MPMHMTPAPRAAVATAVGGRFPFGINQSCALPASMLFPEMTAPPTPSGSGTPGTPVRATSSPDSASGKTTRATWATRSDRPNRRVLPQRLNPAGQVSRLHIRRRVTAGLDWLDRYWDRRDADHSTRYHGGW